MGVQSNFFGPEHPHQQRAADFYSIDGACRQTDISPEDYAFAYQCDIIADSYINKKSSQKIEKYKFHK